MANWQLAVTGNKVFTFDPLKLTIMNPRVSLVHYQNPNKLILTFTNKEVKEFDFTQYLIFPIYEALRDEAFCQKAKVFNGTVMWDEFTDFDPDTLYLESKAMHTV